MGLTNCQNDIFRKNWICCERSSLISIFDPLRIPDPIGLSMINNLFLMKITFYISILFTVGLMGCIGDQGATSDPTSKMAQSNPEMLAQAAAIGKVPTSIGLNFASGYWHIASGFNVEASGDFRSWDGTWLQMKPNHELIWGKNEVNLGSGAWGWNEGLEEITFISDTSKEFFIGEWKTNNKGDVYICIGNTANNPRSTQFKLVRRQSKIVSE